MHRIERGNTILVPFMKKVKSFVVSLGTFILNYLWSIILFGLLLEILLQNVEGAKGSREVSYVGCKRRNTGRALSDKASGQNESALMSVQLCVQLCWYRRKEVAGIQAEKNCYCSFSSRLGLDKIPEKDCNRRCTGNCYQACGGKKALSVYNTGYIREPSFVMEKQAYSPAFIGCYDSRTAGSVLCPSGFRPLWTKRLTIPMCIYYCDAIYQTKFSTIAATDKCCCSNSVHKARNTKMSWCDKKGKPCDGDNKQGCIGTQKNTFQWSTHQRDRIPNFKRWPKSTFKQGKWLRPNFKAGEKYHMKDMSKPVSMSAGDATLMGLLAKKKKNRKRLNKGNQKDEDEPRVIAGADKREPSETGTNASANVVDVPPKKVGPSDDEKGEDSNMLIIGALTAGFVVFLGALSFYLYSKKKKKQETSAVTNESSDDDDDNKDVRRRKLKKAKKKKKKSKKRKRNQPSSSQDDEDDLLE